MRSGKLILYSSRTNKGQKFGKAKVFTIPSQSMTLKEILKRFVRNESLPIAREGVYEDRFEDLEKLSRKDITEQMEVVETLKAGNNSRKNKRKEVEPSPPPAPIVEPDAPPKNP